MSKRVLLLCLLAYVPMAGALYDPDPDAWVTAMSGRWSGSLEYLDYSGNGARVTLPTTLYVAATGPHAVALHYVYDDGPGKTVHSYERWEIDLAARTLRWTSGVDKPQVETCTFDGDALDAHLARATFSCESADAKPGDPPARFTLTLSATALRLQKEEPRSDGSLLVRNRYAFAR